MGIGALFCSLLFPFMHKEHFTFEKGETRGGGTAPPGLSFRGKNRTFSAKRQAV